MTSERRYWKSPDEPGVAGPDEFAEPIELAAAVEGVGRRDFLAAAGFALAASVAGCSQAPERVALPLVDAVEGATPGRAMHYASTCFACEAGCGILVKCRDGRPIKLEGNPEHALSRGGLCAIGQASVLGAYDSQRLRAPLKNGQPSTWREVDAEVLAAMTEIRGRRATVRVLSRTIASPTTRRLVARFLAPLTAAGCDAKLVEYDVDSASAIVEAHRQTHGLSVLPRFRFDRAEVVVGIDADFLGTWISPVQFARDWQSARSAEGETPRFSYHAQFEPRLSLSGAKADERRRILPGEVGLLLTHLAAALARRAGTMWSASPVEPAPAPIDALVDRLWRARGKAMVACASRDVDHQKLCNLVNDLLGAYGATLDLERPSLQRQGNDADVRQLAVDLKAGRVAALLVLDGNPVFDLPDGAEWAAALRGPGVVSAACSERLDETAAASRYICPPPHFLAAWSDAEPIDGWLSVAQPTFAPLGNVRTVAETLAAWSGTLRSARQLVQETWRDEVFPRQSRESDFQRFWERCVHDGFVEVAARPSRATPFARASVAPAARAERPADGAFALVLFPTLGMSDGRHAYNPWLQELPDPIAKTAWDNWASFSPVAADRLGLQDGDVVRIEAGGATLELPALRQPGLHDRVVAIPLGYGSVLSERFRDVGPRWIEARPTLNAQNRVGVNAAPFAGRSSASVVRTGRRQPFASTQLHHSIHVPEHLAPRGRTRRAIVEEATLATLPQTAPARVPLPTLWPEDHAAPGPRWGMAVDLATCTGCSACVVACQAENNVPVVGKDEVLRQREMHWIRIDRYYADAPDGGVDVAFQPMMCQHCGNAPCETVCPVIATAHSSEGLNQQVYNRCVGTRYCANNCPYKVRRFNWFDYPREDALANLVLNPDVTVRSRGVMEKCSFCVQRIQEAKLEARRLGLPVGAAAPEPACQQSCPTKAIVFGDLNDRNSRAARLQADRRAYRVLDELNVLPAVAYLKIVRNRQEPANAGGNHE